MTTKRALPVVNSSEEFTIPWRTLRSIIAGSSVLDLTEIHTKSKEEAATFLRGYGFDSNDKDSFATLEHIRDQAVEYVNEVLLAEEDALSLPEQYTKRPISELICLAANWDDESQVNWSCLILKVCHAIAHALWGHDLEAHEAALKVIKQRVEPLLSESEGLLWIGDDACKIPLLEFKVKKNKKLFRTITKLLHKPGNSSVNIRDHIGVRFVVEDVFSSILLIKFLRSRTIFMYANNIPEDTKNSLANLAHIEELYKDYSPSPHQDLSKAEGRLLKDNKKNPFSSKDFQMIKLVERLLVRLPSGRRTFFPYELQILTRSQYEELKTDRTNHDAYERRQVAAVRDRLLI